MGMRRMRQLSKVVIVEAADMPKNVLEDCANREISTHYQNDIVLVQDDGSPFAEWLKNNGYIFQSRDGDYIGIIAT